MSVLAGLQCIAINAKYVNEESVKQLPKRCYPGIQAHLTCSIGQAGIHLSLPLHLVETHTADCLLDPFLATHVLILFGLLAFLFLLSECVCHRPVLAVSDAVSLGWLAATRTSRPFVAKTGYREAKQPTRAERLSCPPCGQPPALKTSTKALEPLKGGAGRSR